jgi:hypothetical protein
MWGAANSNIRNIGVEGHRPLVLYVIPVDFPQLLCISFLQNIE